MRGDTATDNEEETDDQGGNVAASGRRPSLVTLQNMLKKVSSSPFHNQYKTLCPSVSDSSDDSLKDGELDAVAATANANATAAAFPSPGVMDKPHQSEVGRTRVNPFHAHQQESSKPDDLMENSGGKTATLDSFFVHPPEFHSSPRPPRQADTQPGPEFTDLFQTELSSNGHFHDFFSPAQTQTLSRTPEPPKDEGLDLFQDDFTASFLPAEPTKEVNLFDRPPSIFSDPFKPSSNQNGFLQQSSAAANPFYAASTKELPPTSGGNKHDDLFDMSSFKDIFSSSSANAVDPFPSPITRDLFQEDDPFGPTPSRQFDPFGDVSTPDIFKPPKTDSEDLFGLSSEKKPPPLLLPTTLTTPAKSPPAVPPKPSDARAIVLTTPQGSNHDILQPSPFSRARNLSRSPSEMTHVTTFRRPPKPLPRRRPKPTTPVENEAPALKSSPKLEPKQDSKPPRPAVPLKPKLLETKTPEPENSAVFEDVLLIGQERCVEDWPEDSPELNPDFKPSGKLRLRRESLKVRADSDGGSGEDQDGSSASYGKKKDKKFRLSLLSRRGSKEKFSDDSRSKTSPGSRKSSKDHLSAEENEDVEQNGTDFKKKSLSSRVSLLRRASASSSESSRKHVNGHLPHDSKQVDEISHKGVSKKNSIIRRWSEGTALNDSTGEEEEGGDTLKGKKKVSIRFVPQRGYAISLDKGAQGHTPGKSSKDESLGASGYTPRKKSQTDAFEAEERVRAYSLQSTSKGAQGHTPGKSSKDESLGATGYTPRKKSQTDAFEAEERVRAYSLQSTSKAALMDDDRFLKSPASSSGFNDPDDPYDPYGTDDCKPNKPTKMKPLPAGRRSSKEDMLGDGGGYMKKKSSFSVEDLYDGDWTEKSPKGPSTLPRKSKMADEQSDQQSSSNPFGWDDFSSGKGPASPGDTYDSDFDDDDDDDDVDAYKAKSSSKLKGFKKHKSKSTRPPEFEDPPGAASADFLSEAAQAEWQAAQKDEQAMAGMEDEDEDGDTDSLMEWWNTVEQWDEVPSDEEDLMLKEDESRSFTVLADKVQRGLRVFNKVFTERAELLWQSVITLHAIADNINDFHHKAKIAGITGGTTTAVGGVTAIAGLALAPFTFGASLVITAVGVGVATAGGITSASAAISDNVNNMHDRKKVELVLQDYELHLQSMARILHFINQGLYRLRGHAFLRSGTQHYSSDWEVRRAVQMISLVDRPVERAAAVTDGALAAVLGLFRGMDKFFIKDTRELKKGCKKEVVAQIKEVANVLNDAVVELNAIREELQDATGNT